MCRRPLFPVHIACTIFSLLLFSIVTPDIAHANSNQLACQTVKVPVALAPGQLPQYQIAGELCMRNHPGYLVQVLIPGGSYTHQYWRWPFQPQKYSYVDALTTPNYSTFNIDPLGSGASSRPADSELVSLDAAAYTVHQIIQALRRGTIGGVSFKKVVLVGHSIGSYVLWDEVAKQATTYHDTDGNIDGAIVTGAPHKSSTINSQTAYNYIYPAVQDPKFRNSGLVNGYVTSTAATPSQPSGRQVLFYNTADADPAVIALDEATKDVFPQSELLQGLDSGSLTLQITVPVLSVVGQRDFFFCAPDGTDCSSDRTVQTAEAPSYLQQACLEARILSNSGHDINLHLNAARDWFPMAKTWLDKFFGNAPVQPGRCN